MPSGQEIRSSIHGAFRLAAMDPGGIAYLNISADGFWRSFFAAVLVLPAHIVILATPGSQAAEADWTLSRLIVEFVQYVLGWAAFPVAMVFIARLLDVTQSYAAYIIAHNWAHVPIAIVLLLVDLIFFSNLLAQGLANFVAMSALLAVSYYLWFIARVVLGVVWFVAVGIVVFDHVLRFAVAGAIARLFG